MFGLLRILLRLVIRIFSSPIAALLIADSLFMRNALVDASSAAHLSVFFLARMLANGAFVGCAPNPSQAPTRMFRSSCAFSQTTMTRPFDEVILFLRFRRDVVFRFLSMPGVPDFSPVFLLMPGMFFFAFR